MARRRLPPPAPGAALQAPDPGAGSGPLSGPAPEIKSGYPLGVAPTFARPPVARVAAESAAEAALREVAGELETLRAEGRVVLRLPLAAIAGDWLIRDRIDVDPGELAALRASILAHGQRSPVEVAEIAPGHYGLISGWRRLLVLGELAAADPRFGTVLALLRSPESSAAAYVAMVEENEIRAGLSYWERARVVERAVAAGVFETDRAALQQLFAGASRAKRSKIGSFLGLVRALDGVLHFPAALPERAGLALAAGLGADPGLAGRLAAALAQDPPASAEAEQRQIAGLLTGAKPRASRTSGRGPRRELAPGLWLERGAGRLSIGGPGLGPELQARLEERLSAWLAGEGGA